MFDLSVAFERKVAVSGPAKISYIAAGSGPPMLLLHGFPDHGYGWRKQIEALAPHFRVLVPDLRGIGQSPAPAEVKFYGLPHLVSDALAVLAAEGYGQASIVGHDWGATIAWWLAIRAPRVVRHLVALSIPHPRHYLQAFNDPANAEMVSYIRGFRMPGAASALDIDLLSSWVRDDRDRSALRDTLGKSNLECMLNYYRANIPSVGLADIGPLPPVRAPTLVIFSKNDPFVPERAFARTAQEVDNVCSVIALPRSGHFIHQDASEFVSSQILQWCGRGPTGYASA